MSRNLFADVYRSKVPVCHIGGSVDLIMENLVSLGIDGISIDNPSSLEKMFAAGKGKLTILVNPAP